MANHQDDCGGDDSGGGDDEGGGGGGVDNDDADDDNDYDALLLSLHWIVYVSLTVCHVVLHTEPNTINVSAHGAKQ